MQGSRALRGAAVWAAAWAVLVGAGDALDLGNKALILVLACALSALWWPVGPTLVAGAVSVLAFNVAFVPPTGTFSVDLHQHALLLLAMGSVSGIVALLVARQRQLALQAQSQAQRADELRQLGEALRAVDDPRAETTRLADALRRITGHPPRLWLPPAADDAPDVGPHSALRSDALDGLRMCARSGQAMGPGTGRYETEPAWTLPMRGRQRAHGAALLPLDDPPPADPSALAHAQALCDQMGAALEQAQALHAAAQAREAARSEALRNTLLSAISHDHRTPLASILGAAGALHDQAERLDVAQRRRLAATIVDEATQLGRLTDNLLQLARLESHAVAPSADWESAEEIVGSTLQRARRRLRDGEGVADGTRALRARVEPGLPLLRCDALLIVQALDNLLDNAMKYAPGPVELLARRDGDQVLLAVRDRGPGVPAAQREGIFERFRRGVEADPATAPRRGAGVGLALCRAIATAHGGTLTCRPRHHGGASFELRLPVVEPPATGEPP